MRKEEGQEIQIVMVDIESLKTNAQGPEVV